MGLFNRKAGGLKDPLFQRCVAADKRKKMVTCCVSR